MVRNTLVITYWSFTEAHIQANAIPSIRIMRKYVDPKSRFFLITLEKTLFRIDKKEQLEIRKELAKENIYWLPFKYYKFGLMAVLQWLVIFLRLIFLIVKEKISILHCWCTPAGASGYILSLITGRKLVIDSYEPHAEAMVENGTWKRRGIAYFLLFWFEKKQTQRAQVTIGATSGMYQYAVEKYGVAPRVFYTKPACVDLFLFSESKLKNDDLVKHFEFKDKIVCVLAGKLGGIYLKQEVFDFFKSAYDYWQDKFRVLLLSDHTRVEVNELCLRSDLPNHLISMILVSHVDVPRYIGLADFAITPVKPVPSKKYCTPVKDGEYWAMGLPVIIPAEISDDSKIIEDFSIGAVLHSLDKESYKQAVVKIDNLLKLPRKENFIRIRSIAKRFRGFEIADQVYSEVYKLI